MPNFHYQSLTARGEARSGLLTAPDRAEVVRQLLGRGETAMRVEAVQDDNDPSSAGAARRTVPSAKRIGSAPAGLAAGLRQRFATGKPHIRRAELANLIREIATAIEAGLPLMQSLQTVRRQASGKAMPVMLDYLIDRVEAGDPLFVAAHDYGPPFDDMVIGMLRAADASGEMSQVLHQLADLLDRALELRREVLGATFYPIIVGVLLLVSIIVLVTVLVPKLIGPMQSSPGFRMPLPTQILLSIASFLESYWYVCLAIVALIWAGWWMWSRGPANRMIIDRFKLKMPVAGRLVRDVAVARFTRTLGTLTTAGLPILDALQITRNTLANAALMKAVDEVQDQVTSGKSLADPLERSGLFPALLVQVVNLGERSGRLDSMLLHAATAFDRQVNTSIKIFAKALPPLLLIVMASLGGFVLAAILLPILELQSAIG